MNNYSKNQENVNNLNNEIEKEVSFHVPKSHAPAVYIAGWLCQVPCSQLSAGAKLLYGRLAQWSSAKGTVHRSVNQLSQELGMHPRAIERELKELRDVKLIKTYRKEEGGINYYRFLDHPWMYEPINENLEYQSYQQPQAKSESYPQATDKSGGTPPTNLSVPPDKSVGAKVKGNKTNYNYNRSDHFLAKSEVKPYYPTLEEVKEKSRLVEEKDKKNQMEIAKRSSYFGKSAKEIANACRMALIGDQIPIFELC